MRPVVRLAFVLVLCVALLGLGVHYAESYDDRWPYPTEDQLDESYETHVGEKALVFGEVTRIDAEADELTIEATTSDGTRIELVADSVPMSDGDPAVKAGGFVQVYGVLEPNREMTTTETVVVNPTDTAELYKLGVSALAILGGMVYFLYYWRPTLRGWESTDG